MDSKVTNVRKRTPSKEVPTLTAYTVVNGRVLSVKVPANRSRRSMRATAMKSLRAQIS